ncbi:hypothetical protein FIBSPDRAFT_955180 [Athelia psychrophila]|uniref:MYND-type domain-containing protein n=1 Tax=Athelia psychrophila TaxID=1759441 RepID=A0A166IDT6_9AGAM|nr:hypothetical protein FIBSPDRAFT_955180 [Fibularhizoctonia sp. CBS 109695]
MSITVNMDKNLYLSLSSAVALLTTTMQNPSKANACAARLGVAADVIDQAFEACTSIAAKTKLAKSYPELLRAGIQFLTFKQQPPDHVAMLSRLTACSCDFRQTSMRQLHKPNRFRPDGRTHIDATTLVFDAVATVSNCLVFALADLTQHKFRNANTNKAGDQNWPQSPEDLLPLGPKDSLVGLELWVAGAPLGYIIFKLIGYLSLFYVPFAQEVFKPNFTMPLARPIQHLKEAVKFYDGGDPLPLARTHFFTYPVMTIFEFFSNLERCDTSQFNIMTTCRGSWISPVLARLTTIVATLPQEWSETRSLMAWMSAWANAEIERGVATARFDREHFTELTSFDPVETAFNGMVHARKVGCMNIVCPSLPTEVIHSRLCSRCDLVRYCGEKCQKEAWKCAILSHKPFCAVAHSLKESFGADWPQLWTVGFTYAQFQALCRSKAVDTEVVKAIGNTLSALRVRQSVHRENLQREGESQMERLIRAEKEKVGRQKLEAIKASAGGDSIAVFNREDGISMMTSGAIR